MTAIAMHTGTVFGVTDEHAGDEIRAERQALGLSVKALAERAGVDRGRVAKIEAGEPYRDSTLGAIRRALAEFREEISGPYDDAPDEHVVTFRMSGNFGVDVTVSGPVDNLPELEASVGRLLQRMRNDANGGRSAT